MLENTIVQSMHFNLFSLPVIFAGCITMALGIYAYPKGNQQGQRYFSWLMLACTIYAFFYTLELCSNEVAYMVFFLRLEYIGAVALGPLVWLFTCKYADRQSYLTFRNHILIFIFPVFLLVMVFTNDQHHWFYTEFRKQNNDFFFVLESSKGFLYWVHQAYSIFWVLMGNLILIKMIQNVPRSYISQVLMVLIGSLSSWTAYFLHLMQLIPLDLDAVPFAFAVSGMIIYLGLFQFGLFSMIPVAYKSLFENMSDGVLVIDAAGLLVSLNKSAVKTLGISQKTVGMPVEASLALWPELLVLSKPQNVRSDLEIHRGSEDKSVWLSVDCMPNVNNEVFLGNIVFIRDITERKRAQADLIASENLALALAKQYKSILDSQSVYVLKTDLAGNYTYINDYFLQRFAPNGNGQLLGRYFSDIVVKEDHPKLRKVVESCFFQPETPHEVILKKPTVDGVVKAGKWEFKGILNKKGNLEEILCIGFDITEQIENLEKANELLQVISEQNTKLKSFTYIVSHNIRSHSSNLSGLIQVLKSKPTEQERESYFNLLEVSTNRLDETIRNLNEIIHISENTAKAKTSKQLKQEVEKTLDILNGVIAQNAISVTVNIPEDLSVCIVDSYLDSILLNLLSNAVKYRSLVRPSEIHIFTEKKVGYLVLAIQDNGLGLNLDKYGEKIFGMYKTFHRNEDARGFGLFITKTQIESMGGRITVESREGEGSTFRVFFPLETQQEEVQNEIILNP